MGQQAIPSRLRGGMPCLSVPDVDSAVGYYERFLGFQVVDRIADPPAAVVERDGSAILLRRTEPGEPPRNPGDREYPAWDAVVPVLDFDLTFEDLAVRAVSLQSPVVEHPLLGRTFTIEDRFGHLLCFTQAPDRIGAGARRAARSARLRLRSARFARAATAELRPHLDEFRAFYSRLEDKRDVFYTFFTGGLLHWALKAASFVPPDVNLVFLGAELSTEEREWIATNVDRPFHYIDLPVNDWPVWDFLLSASDENFGWLDIDCFVLDPGVFHDLAKVSPDTAMNCTWSYDSGYGFRFANTYLAFVNAAAVRALRSRGLPVWARPHDWLGGDRSEQAGKRCFYRIPSARERRVMLQVAPADARGRPRPPGAMPFFDTMTVFQILAQSLGFGANLVRDLDSPMLSAVKPGEQPSVAPADMSDELIHVGGISYYREHFHDPAVRTLYLAADYTTLTATENLPSRYQELREAVAAELRAFGVEPEASGEILHRYLCDVGGLSPAAADKAVGTRRTAPA